MSKASYSCWLPLRLVIEGVTLLLVASDQSLRSADLTSTPFGHLRPCPRWSLSSPVRLRPTCYRRIVELNLWCLVVSRRLDDDMVISSHPYVKCHLTASFSLMVSRGHASDGESRAVILMVFSGLTDLPRFNILLLRLFADLGWNSPLVTETPLRLLFPGVPTSWFCILLQSRN